MTAAVFGGTFVSVLVVIVAVGVMLDRRQRSRDAAAAGLTVDHQQRRHLSRAMPGGVHEERGWR